MRNLSPELARIIRRKAEEKRTSINKAVISLLEESVGVGLKKKAEGLHHDLDALAGSWGKKEASTFEKALARQRGIGEVARRLHDRRAKLSLPARPA